MSLSKYVSGLSVAAAVTACLPPQPTTTAPIETADVGQFSPDGQGNLVACLGRETVITTKSAKTAAKCAEVVAQCNSIAQSAPAVDEYQLCTERNSQLAIYRDFNGDGGRTPIIEQCDANVEVSDFQACVKAAVQCVGDYAKHTSCADAKK